LVATFSVARFAAFLIARFVGFLVVIVLRWIDG
jgi:hypothetical protein